MDKRVLMISVIKSQKRIKPFHIFLTTGAGCGKSHLSKAIYLSVSKILMHQGGDVENQECSWLPQRVWLLLLLMIPPYIQGWV